MIRYDKIQLRLEADNLQIFNITVAMVTKATVAMATIAITTVTMAIFFAWTNVGCFMSELFVKFLNDGCIDIRFKII